MQKRAKVRRTRVLAWTTTVAAVLCCGALALNGWLESRVRSLQGESSLIRPSLRGRIAERDPHAPPSAIDLSGFYNAPLTQAWYPGPPDNTLLSLPRGVQKLGGVAFDLRGILQLSGGEISSYDNTIDVYPRQIRFIPIDRWVKRLHFLQGTVGETTEGKRTGSYLVEFASGRTQEIALVYGQNLRSLWQPADSDGAVPKATAVWSGQNPVTRERGLALRLYQQTWDNPWPNEQIVHLSFRSAMSSSAPFLVALSCDAYQPPPELRQMPPDLARELQTAALSFPELEADVRPLTELKSYTVKPIKVGNHYYGAVRLTVPEKSSDLVWAFLQSTNTLEQDWQVLPLQGRLKVGFEDWHHGIPETGKSELGGLCVQFLSAKKLQPGAGYLIWFSLNNAQPAEVRALLHFAPPGEVNPNRAETLVRSLGLQDRAQSEHLRFHRHFCL